jgi:hypothetical protein
MSPEPQFVAAPSLAAMAGLSTPDPWRGRRPEEADNGHVDVASPARSALAETERSVRARVQVRAGLGIFTLNPTPTPTLYLDLTQTLTQISVLTLTLTLILT